MIVTPCLTTSLPASVPSTLPPVSAAMSTMTLPGFMEATIASVTSFGAGRPGIRAVVMTKSASLTRSAISAAWRRLVVVAHLAGVAAGGLGVRLLLLGHLDLDEDAAQALDLLLDDRPHVGRLDHRAEAPRGADRHQPRHAGAHDDPSRRPDGARGGGQQRHELRQPLGGDAGRPCSRRRWPGDESVSIALGAGDARDGVHADGGHAASRPGVCASSGFESVPRVPMRIAPDRSIRSPRPRAADAKDHIRLAVERRRVRDDRRARLAEGLVADEGRVAGPGWTTTSTPSATSWRRCSAASARRASRRAPFRGGQRSSCGSASFGLTATANRRRPIEGREAVRDSKCSSPSAASGRPADRRDLGSTASLRSLASARSGPPNGDPS